MNYLVIAATAMEIGPFVQQVSDGAIIGKNGLTLPGGDRLDVLVTGVGLTATTYTLTRQVALRRPDFIIQAGIAGSFDEAVERGSVVVVGREVVADQGVWEKDEWKSTLDMGFTPADIHPYTGGWLINNNLSLNTNGLPVVNGVSVNQVSTDVKLIETCRRKYNATVESMEGAALHFVAISERIPFLQLRAVSNNVGDRDKKNWDFKNAIQNLNKELLLLLPQS